MKNLLVRTAALTAAVTGLLAAGVAAPAAAAPTGDGQSGWLRLAHLSPDTKQVDVAVSSVSGGELVFELDDVGYGAVSPYTDLPGGAYTITMVPSDAADDAAPVISASVDVSAGRAITVAAYGPNDDLQASVFADDLTAPGDGQARIRLIQASTLTDSVTVETTDGAVIAEDAATGRATGYASIPAGDWNLELTGTGEVTGDARVTVASGTVTTLFVLDDAEGDLTILPVLDSAASGDTPVGGVDTGGGYLAGSGVSAGRAAPQA